MNLEGARILLAGGGGALGGRLAPALAAAGAEVVATAREPAGLGELAARLGTGAVALELTEPGGGERAVADAVAQLGGLDAVVIATGSVAFGDAGDLDPSVAAELFAVNATGPVNLISAALPALSEGGAIAAITAVVAEFPTAGMAAYSASKAALSAYLSALRREQRRRLSVVLEVRPGHMDTGFAERALAGKPPRLPPPQDPDLLVERIVAAIESGTSVLRYDPLERELIAA